MGPEASALTHRTGEEPGAWHASMLPSFGALFYMSGLAFAMRKVRMEDHSCNRVRLAAERGPLVYVLHTHSHVDWLALNEALIQRKLPLPVYSDGIDHSAWLPLSRIPAALLARFRRRSLAPPSTWLAGLIASGQPVCLFLSPGQSVREFARFIAGLPVEPGEELPSVLRAQGLCSRPIQILPVAVIWNRSPEPVRSEVERFVLGGQEDPGTFGKLWDLANASNGGLVQVGEPVSIQEFQSRFKEEPEPRQRKLLRLLLRRYLHRETTVVRGPRLHPWRWVRREVLQGPEIAALVREEAMRTGRDQEHTARKVARVFDKMSARFSFPWVRLFHAMLMPVFQRVFSGIDIREEDLDRIRAALRAGTPILLPNHRSHLDYLLISVLLYEHDIALPHVVAGDNLSFWPLGALLRRGGAFFIKRSFTGDRIFPVIFARYLRQLVRMGVPVEFYIEGGRSRTGKLLPPRLGVFAMIADATVLEGQRREVSLLPIHIAYEQIAEERVFARELAGAPKEKESVGGVFRATGVLRHRYGKVVVRVGEPVSATTLTRPWTGHGAAAGAFPVDEAQRREVLRHAALTVMQRIQRIGPAMPTGITAAALLAHSRRGIRHEDLHARYWRFLRHLDRAGVARGGGLSLPDSAMEQALDRFVSRRLLEPVGEGAQRVFGVPAARRISLEYYKNSLLWAFSGVSFYAAAVRGLGEIRVDTAAARRLFELQLSLLRAEILPDPDRTPEELAAEAQSGLVAYGALGLEDGQLVVVSRALVGELANLSANLLESYLLVLRTAAGTKGRLFTADELPNQALVLGRSLLTVEEVVRAEALSLQNLQHAVKVLGADGLWTARAGGRLELVTEKSEPLRRELQLLLGDGPAGGG